MNCPSLFCLVAATILVHVTSLVAQDNLPRKAETFKIQGGTAVLYTPAKPAEGKPWLWYAPTLNGGVSLAGQKMYFDAFMKAGISLAGYDLGEVRGSPVSTAKFTLFYDAMVKRGYSSKPILLGQSRGGMMTLAWAFRNPDKLRAWVGIYPVCNLASWPLKSSKPQTLTDFAMPEAELVANLSKVQSHRQPARPPRQQSAHVHRPRRHRRGGALQR